MTFRQLAVALCGPEVGNRAADDYANAMGRAFDAALFGTDTKDKQMTDRHDETDAATKRVDALYPTAPPAERLGLIVGTAYGDALAERDQARDVAALLGERLSLACGHLEAVLSALPDPPTFAADEDAALAARAFLADVVPSPQTPEQEVTT